MDTRALCPSTGRPLTRSEVLAIVAAEPELVAAALELVWGEQLEQPAPRKQPRVKWMQGEDGGLVAVAGPKREKQG